MTAEEIVEMMKRTRCGAAGVDPMGGPVPVPDEWPHLKPGDTLRVRLPKDFCVTRNQLEPHEDQIARDYGEADPWLDIQGAEPATRTVFAVGWTGEPNDGALHPPADPNDAIIAELHAMRLERLTVERDTALAKLREATEAADALRAERDAAREATAAERMLARVMRDDLVAAQARVAQLEAQIGGDTAATPSFPARALALPRTRIDGR